MAEQLQSAQASRPYRLVWQRLCWMLIGSVATYVLLKSSNISTGMPPISGLYIMVPNVIGLVSIRRIFKKYDISFWKYLGYSKSTIRKDIVWALLWLMVTYVPFAAVMYISIWLLFGVDFVSGMQWLMVPEAVSMNGWLSIVVAFVCGVLFVINAPVEEIVYRGWLQQGLGVKKGAAYAIVV